MSESEDLEKGRKLLDTLYHKAVAAREARDERAHRENSGPTATEIAKKIWDALPEYHHMMFSSKQGQKIGDQDAVMVTYASVPKSAAEIDAMNAQTNPMWHINAAKGESWFTDKPSPAKVTIEMHRGSIRASKERQSLEDVFARKRDPGKIVFRSKTGTPAQVIKYLVDFMKKNRAAFLPSK